jgi:hypothetical protein
MMWLWAALSSSAVLLLARTAAASTSSSPAPWPDAFSVKFLTNATTNSSDRSTCVRNTLHYDWGLKMQAVVHGPGAIECAHFYNTSSACTLVFTAESMYRVLAEPRAGQKSCCKDTGSPFGMTPPTWASGSNATFEGFVQDPFSGMLAKKFAWPQLAGPMGMHTYLETTVGQRQPLAFTFPAHNGLQDYHFLTDTQTNTRPDAGVFALPGECADEVC